MDGEKKRRLLPEREFLVSDEHDWVLKPDVNRSGADNEFIILVPWRFWGSFHFQPIAEALCGAIGEQVRVQMRAEEAREP